MDFNVENRFRFWSELRLSPNLDELPLSSADVTDDLPELIQEAAIRSVLAERLPLEPGTVQATIRPVCREGAIVERIEIELAASRSEPLAIETFHTGRWHRAAQQKVLLLREEGTVTEQQQVYHSLVAVRHDVPIPVQPSSLAPPQIVDGTLADFGIRTLTADEFTPDRPVLVNVRLEDEAIQNCQEAGVRETGGAVAGVYLRLPERLSGASSRIVTVLSSLLMDPRHEGDESRFHFSPLALAEAQELCRLRGLGESIVTVFHTHGWGCGDCHQKAECAVAEAKPSLQDYQLLESLFPGKSTALPIAGRKLGAEGRRPVLQIFAWRMGEMRPIRWRRYHD